MGPRQGGVTADRHPLPKGLPADVTAQQDRILGANTWWDTELYVTGGPRPRVGALHLGREFMSWKVSYSSKVTFNP